MARPSPVTAKMEMEIDPPANPPEAADAKLLFTAAESGDAAAFSNLSPDQLRHARSLRNDDRRCLLHVAAASGHAEIVNILSDAHPSSSGVNSTDEEGWAPLHSASSSGRVSVVEILLSRGADANLSNDGGRTALHYAASKGHIKIAELLLAHGAKLKKDKVGCTPLHRAASTGNSELCELLIEEGAEVDAVDKVGQTPLMHAVICQNKEVAFLLIRHGADVDVQDREGYTVLGRTSNDLRPALLDAAKAMLEG